jgi:hypothetical protein
MFRCVFLYIFGAEKSEGTNTCPVVFSKTAFSILIMRNEMDFWSFCKQKESNFND